MAHPKKTGAKPEAKLHADVKSKTTDWPRGTANTQVRWKNHTRNTVREWTKLRTRGVATSSLFPVNTERGVLPVPVPVWM